MSKMTKNAFFTHDKLLKNKQKKSFSTTKKIVIGFALLILVGTILLSLPLATANGDINVLTALFTATTSVCVTGLVVVDTFSYWSLFGKIIILILIQIGGMGIVAIICGLMMVFHRRVNLKERIVIQDAYNLHSPQGVIRFVKKVIIGTLLVESVGALIYMIEFIPIFGIVRGVCYSVFNSISAFCNAGIDIIGSTSLMPFNDSPIILINTMMLIFNGGIGFVVWWDIVGVIKKLKKREIRVGNVWGLLTIHTRITLMVTFFLIFVGALLIMLFESNNNGTISNMKLENKILNSLFQSVTLRTAGFASFSQENMNGATVFVSIILMLIGGSPVGTAGGVKTTTVFVLLATVISVIKGRNETIIFNRSINFDIIKKSLSVVIITISFFCLFSILLVCTNDFSLGDSMFEVASALGTVGLTRGITSELNNFGQIIIIIAMYLGRIGPISMLVAFSNRSSSKNSIHYPEADIIVG